jgi:two-component system, OmpR family, KDP operon response regulator KdpE
VARVLVVDDDPSLRRALRIALGSKDHEVTTAETGEQGMQQTAVANPDVVILDLGLPGMDGIDVCREIRQWSDVPIIVLSATDTEARKVLALDVGADDYVTKPFGMAELEARIRTALRHRKAPEHDSSETTLSVGRLDLDLIHHEATLDARELQLTSKEFDLLSFLVRHHGRTCTHEMILSAVWGRGYERETQYLHAYIHRLRQKMGEGSSEIIRSVAGVGYELNES